MHDSDRAKLAGRGTARWQKVSKAWTFPVDPTIARLLGEEFPDLHITADLEHHLAQGYARHCQVLKTCGREHPLWPDTPLWPFQWASVRYLVTAERCILGHQMGTGKTVIAAAAMGALEAQRILVVCPGVVKWSWVEHLRSWHDAGCPPIYVVEPGAAGQPKVLAATYGTKLISGTADERFSNLRSVVQTQSQFVIVTTYDQVRTQDKAYLADYDVIVADEAHRLKNRKAMRTQTFGELAERTRYLWLLTGTPVRNSYTDLYSLLHLCDPVRFTSYWNFVRLYMLTVEKPWGGVEIIRPHEPERFNQMLTGYMFRKEKSEVLAHLPPVIYQDLKVPMTAEQERLYRQMEKELRVLIEKEMEEGKTWMEIVQATNTVSKIIRLRQLCLSPALLGGPWQSGKLSALADLVDDLESAGQKFVIFSCSLQWIKLVIARILQPTKIKYAVITGEVKDADRTVAQTALATGEVKCVIGTIGAMGEGVNLQAAQAAIFTDQDWVPGVNQQAEERIHRPGIITSPTIYRLLHPKTVDVDVWATCRRKEKIVTASVGQVALIQRLIGKEEGV